MQEEQYMSQVLAAPENFSPLHVLSAVAMGRWLNVTEIEALLNHNNPILDISTTPPASPPTSGQMFLFNRSVTRNYKDDGHQWVRKKNSNKVREDHVKLRVGGKFRVSGCYVHSSTCATFHRRAYHLLDAEKGTALYPVVSASKVTDGSLPPSLILVHYLDTSQANNLCRILTDKGIDINPTLPDAYMENQSLASAVTSARSAMAQNYSQEQFHQKFDHSFAGDFDESGNFDDHVHNYDDFDFSNDDLGNEMQTNNDHHQQANHNNSQKHYSNEKTVDDDNDAYMDTIAEALEEGNDLQAEAIDFLWDVVVEEQQDSDEEIELNGSNLSEMLTPDLVQNMFGSKIEGNLFEHGELFHTSQTEIMLNPENALEYATAEQISSAIREPHEGLDGSQLLPLEKVPAIETKDFPISFGEAVAFPNIVDITPDNSSLERVQKMVISLDNICPDVNSQAEGHLAWKHMVCFARANLGNGLHILKSVEARMLNPYSCKCDIPEHYLRNGDYKVIVVAIKVDSLLEHSQRKISIALHRVLEAVYYKNDCKLPFLPEHHCVDYDDTHVKLLSQLSDCIFTSSNPIDSDGNSTGGASSSMNSHNLKSFGIPAPPPAMALVATMMTDFPNPPASAVLPPESMINKGDNKLTFEEAKEQVSDRKADQVFGSAIEQTISSSRKRSASTILIPRTHDINVDLGQAPVNADEWAGAESSDPESNTKVEAVDRHCKIRFVERLTSVISEAAGENVIKDTIPDNLQKVEITNEGNSTEIVIDRDEIKALEDDELDHVLDCLLVRIVESLVEMSASESELQEELNSADASGFTLLHYAALYNLQSLIPVLLSRGANPDIKSTRGDLTPLHLACGAGNTAIVELLLRQGCAVEVADCFGSFPMDHAIRNGFKSLAALLQDVVDSEKGLQDKSHVEAQVQIDEKERKKKLKKYEQMRLKEAFSNLSLKEKVALNVMFKQRLHKKSTEKKKEAPFTIVEGDNESEAMEDEDENNVAELSEANLAEKNGVDRKRSDSGSKGDSDDLGSILTESDRESLDIAMTLMNAKELADIEKNAHVHEEFAKWMSQRNYNSLLEASQHLEQTILEHKANGGNVSPPPATRNSPGLEIVSDPVQDASKSYATNAVKLSLKQMKDQALAALVVRKNLNEAIKKKGSAS